MPVGEVSLLVWWVYIVNSSLGIGLGFESLCVFRYFCGP